MIVISEVRCSDCLTDFGDVYVKELEATVAALTAERDAATRNWRECQKEIEYLRKARDEFKKMWEALRAPERHEGK